MFIQNNMQPGQNFLSKSAVRVSAQPQEELTRVERDKQEKAEQKLALTEETPAAVFTRSTQKDYAGKKLTPQQKAITELQERIADVKSNESLSPEEKKEQLKKLDEQLSSLQEALQKSQADELEKFKTQKEAKEKADEKKQETAATDAPGETPVLNADLLALGANLDRAQSTQSLSAKYKRDAAQQQHDLDDFIQRNDTPDADIVAKRREEIHATEAAASRLEDAAATVLKDTDATAKTQDRASESILAQPKDAAADETQQQNAATSMAKSEDEARDKSVLL